MRKKQLRDPLKSKTGKNPIDMDAVHKYLSDWRKGRTQTGELRKPSPAHGGTGRPKSPLADTDYAYLSSKSDIYQANIHRAGVDYLRDRERGQEIAQREMYAKTRSVEEATFFGEHNPETLKIAQRRSKFWGQVDPVNMRKEFLIDRLGFTETQANILRSGKFPRGGLRKQFSLKMAEFEIMGHLPRSEYLARVPSFGDTTRVISFGQYSREPGAFFSGMFESGKSMFIRAEQQRSFMDEVFGVTKKYRMAGTGKLVTPEQLSRLKIASPSTDLAAVNLLDTKEKVRAYIEKNIDIEEKLARKERMGWVDPTKATSVNPYEYNVGKPGRRKDVPRLEDENTWMDRMTREAMGEAPEPINISGQEGLVSRYGDEAPDVAEAIAEGADPWSLTGESTSGLAAAEEATVRDQSVAYIENSNWHQKRLKELRTYREKALIYKWVKPRNKDNTKSILKFMGYKPELEESISRGVKEFTSTELKLKGKSREEIEQIISGVRKGSVVSVKEGKKWVPIEEEDATKLSELYLQDTAEKSSKLFSTLKNDIPVRAQAEQVFEVYFKKQKGRGGHAVYTAAGTFIGETDVKSVPSKAYAKIFEWKGKYQVGWSSSVEDFSSSRYGAAEQAMSARTKKPIREINNILDFDDKFRLKDNPSLQDKLKRIYEQTGEDYKLIAKYKFDREVGSFVDVETGKAVDEAVANTYFAKVEKTYERSSRAAQKLHMKKVKTIDLTAGEGGAGKVPLGSRLAKGKNMIFAALSVSAALVALTAFSSRKKIMSPRDIPREQYGSNTDDERMYTSRPPQQNRANITPEYSGPMGYRTNIDVEATDNSGIDHRNFSEIMHRHATNTLRVPRDNGNTEINDNSDKTTSYQLQRRYANMLRG